MKFCMPHWDGLKEKVKEAGVFLLVADSGEEVVANLQAEAEGDESKYDPLMDAHNRIMSNALNQGGLYLMEGEHCPLCELDKYAPPPPEGTEPTTASGIWIKFAVDEVLAVCIERGLVPRTN